MRLQDFFRNSGFSKRLYFTIDEQITVPAFCRTLNFENQTSITGLIFKIQSSTESWDCDLIIVKYKSVYIPFVLYLQAYTPLFSSVTTSGRAQLALLNRIQDYCYDNMNFTKAFQRIVLLFYKSKACIYSFLCTAHVTIRLLQIFFMKFIFFICS